MKTETADKKGLMDDLEKKNVFALAFFAVSNNSVVAFQLFQIGPRTKREEEVGFWYTPDLSNTTFFTPIPIPNIFKEALTIPNTNTNCLKRP